MGRKALLAVLTCAVASLAVADPPEMKKGPDQTKPPFSSLALMPGAVYEVRLEVPSEKAEDFLAYYATWYLPVDQAKGSGRKLVSVLSNQIGDEYNLVFLYWYESPYKEDYYCKYTKAFFDIHKDSRRHKGTPGFNEQYEKTRKELGRKTTDADFAEIDAKLASCQNNNTPIDAEETIAKFDRKIDSMIASQQSSWSFGVNPCFVMRLRDARKVPSEDRNKKPIEDVAKEMREKDRNNEDLCKRTLLEQAIAFEQAASPETAIPQR